MAASHEPLPRRPLVQRVYRRLSDWCWSVLTRDLHPRPYPSRMQSFWGLISDVIWYGRSLHLPDEQE